MANLVAFLNNAFAVLWTAMAGTEVTWEYQVIAATAKGRVGVRDFTRTGSPIRVRVEPAPGVGAFAELARALGWKQPGDGGQPRHSVVVPSGAAAESALEAALRALGVGAEEFVTNPSAPAWALAVVERVVAAPAAEPTPAPVEEPAVEAAPEPEVAHPVAQAMFAEATGCRAAAAELASKAEALVADAEERVRAMLEEVQAEAAQIVAEAQASNQRATALEYAAGQFAQSLAAMAALGVTLPTPTAEAAEPTFTVDQLRALGRADLRQLLRNRGEKAGVTLSKEALIKRLLGLD